MVSFDTLLALEMSWANPSLALNLMFLFANLYLHVDWSVIFFQSLQCQNRLQLLLGSKSDYEIGKTFNN